MIKEVKLLWYHQNFGGYLPLPCAIYMYKIVKSLNVFFSLTSWTILIRFHMGPSVERGIDNLFEWFRAIEQDGRHAELW